MNNFWVGFSVGAGVILGVMFLVAILGCESVADVMVEPGVVNKVETGVPGRPPLPEGWRGEGDMWINDLTCDTIFCGKTPP